MAEVQDKRFRFGLRSFLLGFTFLAVWFGYRAARQLRAEVMARHHWAIVNQLIESADSLPSGATFAHKVNSPKSRPWYCSDAPVQYFTDELLDHGRWYETINMEVLLDVPDVSRTDPKVILAHYEAGLSELGLKKTADRWSVRGGQVLWSAPHDDLWARFDAEVNEQSRTVKVQMLFVDERQLHAW